MLDRSRASRKFRRIAGAALTACCRAAAGVTAAAPAPNESGSIDLDAVEDPEEGSPS